MKPASFYRQQLNWKQRIPGEPDTFGQTVDTYSAGLSVWAKVDGTTSNREQYLGSDQNTQRATVYVRGFLPVKMDDTLTDGPNSQTWEVVSVHTDEDEYETVCECERRDGHDG